MKLLGSSLLAVVPIIAVACGSSTGGAASSATKVEQDSVEITYGTPIEYKKEKPGYDGPFLKSTNYSSSTNAGESGISALFKYSAQNKGVSPQNIEVDLKINVLKKTLAAWSRTATLTLGVGKTPSWEVTLPEVDENYGSWSEPVYMDASGTVIETQRIANMQNGQNFTANYFAPLKDPKNFSGANASFIVLFRVANVPDESFADSLAVEYGEPANYTKTISDYAGPTLVSTNYTRSTPAGAPNVSAVYEYRTRNTNSVYEKIQATVAITVNKKQLPPFSQVASAMLTKGQKPAYYSALPALEGYGAWGTPEYSMGGTKITPEQIAAMNEGGQFSAYYKATVKDAANYVKSEASFVVKYTIRTAVQASMTDEKEVQYGETLSYESAIDGYGLPVLKSTNYTKSTPAGSANITAIYEHAATTSTLVPQLITTTLSIRVLKKQLTNFERSVAQTHLAGQEVADYESLPVLPPPYGAWSAGRLESSAGTALQKQQTASLGSNETFKAVYTAAISDLSNYAGNPAKFTVDYTVKQSASKNPSMATDAVAPYTTKKPMPTEDWLKTADQQKLMEISELLKQARQIKSQVEITNNPSGTVAPLNLPGALSFSGQPNQAKLEPLKINAETNANFTFKLYKKTSATTLQQLADPTDPQNVYSLSNGEQVVLLAFNKSDGQPKQGASYQVAGIDESLQAVRVLTDPLTQKIKSKNATLEDVFTFMDSLQPGETYTSKLAQSGKIQAVKIPDSRKMQTALAIPAVRRNKNGLYAPFVDASLAVGGANSGSAASYKDLFAYEALNLGFIQAKETIVNGYRTANLAWGGSVVIDDLDPLANGQDSDSYQALKFLYDLRANNVDAAISFGGLSGVPISNFYDPILLAKVLEEFVKGTNSTRIDYDIEGGDAKDEKGMNALAEATALLQQKMLAEGKRLEIGLTLASEYFGLADGKLALDAFVANGVALRYVNGMTMMMNTGFTKTRTIAAQQEYAIESLKSNVEEAYKKNGLALSEGQAYALVGATPDIGADTWKSEVMRPEDVAPLYQMLSKKVIGFFSFWNVQAYLTSVNGLRSYMAGQSVEGVAWDSKDRNLFADTMSKLNDAAGWSAYDPEFFGVGAYTNANTRKALLTKILNSYEDGQTKPAAMTKEQATGIVLQPGQVFEWVSTTDGLNHLWKTSYYAESSQRPGAAPSGQFVDLGVYDSVYESKIAQAKASYEQIGSSYFSVVGLVGSYLQQEISSSVRSVTILPFNKTTLYGEKDVLVILGTNIYVTSYWAGINSDPAKDAAWKQAIIN